MSSLNDKHLGGVHHLLELLLFTCGMYNLVRFADDKQPRNLLLALGYFGGAYFEKQREQDHARQ